MDALLSLPAQFLIACIGMLDSLPGYIRATVAGLLLVSVLRLFESKIPETETQYGVAFRKAVLIVLAAMPLLVWLFPASRLVVFVDQLPVKETSVQWGWLILVGLWAAGLLAGLTRLVRRHVQAFTELATLRRLTDNPKLLARLQHWQGRLGMRQPLELIGLNSGYPCHLPGKRHIGFPAGAVHWPQSAQDVLIIQELCHLKRRHRGWHLFAQFISCCYWPITWVPKLHRRLLQDFQQSAHRLSESCYRDPMGYRRAIRELEKRLDWPSVTTSQAEEKEAPPKTRGQRLQQATAGYAKDIARLWSPSAELSWETETLDISNRPHWSDPYDRVFLYVGQAVLVAFLFTSATLRETPPEIERDYSAWLTIDWMNGFQRNLARFERQEPKPDKQKRDERFNPPETQRSP